MSVGCAWSVPANRRGARDASAPHPNFGTLPAGAEGACAGDSPRGPLRAPRPACPAFLPPPRQPYVPRSPISPAPLSQALPPGSFHPRVGSAQARGQQTAGGEPRHVPERGSARACQ